MKELYYHYFDKLSFCLLVGNVHSYFDRDIKWQRLNLSVVKKRNAQRCPRLWEKPTK